MSDKVEPTGNEAELPRRGFMAKASAVTAGIAATPLLTRLTFAGGVVTPKIGTPAQPLKLVRPRLNLQIRVPEDLDVTTTIERVAHKHNFAENLTGVVRRARIDLTTPRTGATIRDPGSMADDDTCCCVRG